MSKLPSNKEIKTYCIYGSKNLRHLSIRFTGIQISLSILKPVDWFIILASLFLSLETALKIHLLAFSGLGWFGESSFCVKLLPATVKLIRGSCQSYHTVFADEDYGIWSKAPEQAKKWKLGEFQSRWGLILKNKNKKKTTTGRTSLKCLC